uniref:Outer capsid protein VP2 n=1 Tax=Changuinola virus TaxID=40052 RepID=W5QLZ2_9REOV|nr:VP2 [Changuinola virus]
MATEFSIAIANLDERRCQSALMDSFDLLVDTAASSNHNTSGWSINEEVRRRNIFCWGNDTRVDMMIDGIPGNESYISVPRAIDLVLGTIDKCNLDDKDVDVSWIQKEVQWDQDMQSQEWTVSTQSHYPFKPKVESAIGDVYAQTYHFETLFYHKMPKKLSTCDHDNHDVFNQCVYSNLHHIVHNTAYMIDTSYRVFVQDTKPYIYPLGIINEYKTMQDYDRYKAGSLYDDELITDDSNSYNSARKSYLLERGIDVNDGEDDDFEIQVTDDEVSRDANLTKVVIHPSNSYVSWNRNVYVKKEIDEEYNISDSDMSSTYIIPSNPIVSEIQTRKLTYDKTNKKVHVNPEIGSLFSDVSGTGAETTYGSLIMDGGELDRQKIIKMTNVKFTENQRTTIGYGPLRAEGEITAAVIERWRNDETMSEFANFLTWNKVGKIDVNKICKIFGDYSRSHPNHNVIYKDAPDVCKKFQMTFNALYNVGYQQANAVTGYRDGWTVDPDDITAFRRIDEISAPPMKTNCAKMGIILASVIGGCVTDRCDIHTIRGGYLLINKAFGNVYNLLEETFNWKIWRAEKRQGWRGRGDPKITPLLRMDVYRSIFKKGWSGVGWQFYWNENVDVEAEGGYPFFKENIENSCYFDDALVTRYNQAILNSVEWSDVHTDIDQLLNSESQFRSKDILSDFYLDKYKVLVTPWYYGKKIYYNVIANCCYKCVPIVANATTLEDKNQFKHNMGQRLLVPNNWFYPFQDQFDEISICEGKSLSNNRQNRGRLERTYIDTIARNAEFRNYVERDEVAIIDTGCPIAYTTRYVIWYFYHRLFNIFVNFFPYESRKKFQRPTDHIPLFPNTKVYDYGLEKETRDLNGAIYQLFIEAYGALLLKGRDRGVWMKQYQGGSGAQRIKMLKDTMPGLYNHLVDDGNSLDSYFVINFLLLLTTTSTNISNESDTYAPICYCDGRALSVYSIRLSLTNKSNILSHYVGYLTRFYGLKKHRQWNEADDFLLTLRRKAIDFYIGKCIVTLTPNVLVQQTKHQNLNLWIGTKCGGVSDVLIFTQAIVHPHASYFTICICMRDTDVVALKLELARIFSASLHTSIGHIIVRVAGDKIKDIYVEGDLSVREMKRNFWGLDHDMILVKSRGRIFGNKHLVTKLMNIRS